MKRRLSLILILILGLAACAPRAEPSTPTPLPTPDPCAGAALQAAAQAVHSKMREFDDASALASVTPRDQLPAVITDLQRIRREAQDLSVPSCLDNLKRLQIAHMNTVIETLMAFLGGASGDVVNRGVSQARQLHDLYTLELMRVLGLTLVPATASPTLTTPEAQAPGETVTPQIIMVVNPGPATVNMRADPSLDAASLGVLAVGAAAPAVGRTADGTWILIEVPGQPGVRAWVYTSLITLSGPIEALPGVTR